MLWSHPISASFVSNPATNELQLTAKTILWIVALFYAYGALVHVMNILGMTGFDWLAAPKKWQVLDVVYLILDAVVAAGFFLQWKLSYLCFYVAALTQIVLYTAFKSWILDVPEEFAVSLEQAAYLDTLVVFHVVTLLLVSGALFLLFREPAG